MTWDSLKVKLNFVVDCHYLDAIVATFEDSDVVDLIKCPFCACLLAENACFCFRQNSGLFIEKSALNFSSMHEDKTKCTDTDRY